MTKRCSHGKFSVFECDVCSPPKPVSQITGMNMFQIMVCSELDEAGALAWVQKEQPAGTERNWQPATDLPLRPVACESDNRRMHYVFEA